MTACGGSNGGSSSDTGGAQGTAASNTGGTGASPAASGGGTLPGGTTGTGATQSGGSGTTESGGTGATQSGGTGAAQSGGSGTTESGGTGATQSGGSGAAESGGTGAAHAGGAAGADPFYVKPSEPPPDEDGAQLWLRYPQVVAGRLEQYRAALSHVVGSGDSATLQAAEDELVQGLSGLTGVAVPVNAEPQGAGAVVLGTPESSQLVAALPLASRLGEVGTEGYLVQAVEVNGAQALVIAGNSDVGVLYGSFALLRHLQSHRSVEGLALRGAPRIEHRVLNHWDNLDGTVERGYAGSSIWNWDALPGAASSQRYIDYARANASIGINGTVLTNVNADYNVLTSAYLQKVKALADVFRTYGIRVYLTAQYDAPIHLGGPSTADPTNQAVRSWWASKAGEIYQLIPDFGGFLVKANSEGQSGPQADGKTHADGANMLAEAVAGHGGIVMWRAFVYSMDNDVDRITQAYAEFKPFDGQFVDNVVIQVKNGPLDFQPREPFSSLFGAMPQTPLALELQITKEYLGQDSHLAYLGTLYEEVLQADTYANGEGSTVAKVIDGSLDGHSLSVIAGVSNVGSDRDWTGSHFNQANWYAYGRMAWDPDISAEEVADEWVRQTFSNDPAVVTPVKEVMMKSREAVVNYMTPLGLAHIMATEHHYGPAPWVGDLSTPAWNPTYYHRADSQGIGFDRTGSGSNAVGQYSEPLRGQLSSKDSILQELLLFFHHVGWQETTSSGRSVWEELVHRYSLGVDSVGAMRQSWHAVSGYIDEARFDDVSEMLVIQHSEARWWRDACLQYFSSVANLEIPSGYAQPANSLSFYQGLSCPSDRDKPRCPAIMMDEPSPAILP